MKWIKYQITCNGKKNILLDKKLEYSDANLAIAKKEAYYGLYEIVEEGKAIMNENLLVNSNFVNPVNSRRIVTKVGTGQWIDKWFSSVNDAVSIGQITEDGIFLEAQDQDMNPKYASGINLAQILPYELTDNLKGKTVTFSVGTGLGNTLSLTATIPTEFEYYAGNVVIAKKDFSSITLYIASRYKECLFVGIKACMNYMGNIDTKVRWAKLEIGSEATPYVARTYDEELASCSTPLILEMDADIKKNITDTVLGDEALDAVLRGRQILVRTPSRSGDHYQEIFSPVLTYQLPHDGSNYLYLFYLRDEKQTIDLTAIGLGSIEVPVYGEIQLMLSKEFKECPVKELYY